MSGTLVGYAFAVGDNPFCCWEYDHRERNLEYLQGIDTGYFSTIAGILAAEIETNSESEWSASIAIRALYQQAIEALMSLLGAMIQAPGCVAAWIGKCRTQDLEEIVGRLAIGHSLLTQSGQQRLTFATLAGRTHRYAWTTESGDDSTAARFGLLWARLSVEFLDPTARAEYNAIKHGHRVSPGGFVMSIGTEEGSGVPAPAEAMRSIGGSRHGSRFFKVEQVGETTWNIRARRTSINWSVEALIQRLHLISLSITNVVAALQCEEGVNLRELEFERPIDPAVFDMAWAHVIGVRHSSLDTIMRIEARDEPSRAELLDHLQQRSRT